MCEHLLSQLHIQKLGHTIEEIRLRALSCVISKYNLNLVDERNIENTKLLLEKLLNWFSFENYAEEDKVLSLMLKILNYENADLIFKEIDTRDFKKQFSEIESKVGCKYSSLCHEIKACITKIEDETKSNFFSPFFAFNDKENLLNGGSHCGIYNSIPNDTQYVRSLSRESKYTELDFSEEISQTENSVTEIRNVKNEEDCVHHKLIFKVEYFPWQHLTSGDKHVLSSVYNGLRYIDNKTSILQACHFFNEVLLRDFPTEVLIQRPLIIRTLLQLLECGEQVIKIPVLKCLIKIVECLKESIHFALNASLFTLKQEFYTTSVFPDTSSEKDDSSEHSGLPEHLHLNMASFEEDLQFDDNDGVDLNIKHHQISVPQFCFETLFQVLPHLGKKCSLEEMNLLLTLSYKTITCLVFNMNSDIWSQKNDLRGKFQKIFGILNQLLKFHKDRNHVVYVIFLYITVKLLNFLKPPSEIELDEILVRGLHTELASCVSDFVLFLLFPHLHSEIVKYVEKFIGQKEKEAIQDHKDVLLVLDSMKCSVKCLKSLGKMKTKMEKLECVNNSLPSLDFHQCFTLIHCFLNACLLKWRKSQLKEPELKLREKILVKLLAHGNDFVKMSTYREVGECAVKLLGIEEAAAPKYDVPGDRMDFLFQTEILTEIICHGLTSSLDEVRQRSGEILIHLLKSKFIMSDICWNDFLTVLTPCLSVLQCFGDKSTPLGRCIVKMFDPDVAKSTGLPPIEILKGNIRFLYSKNNLTRDEAISRLFWMLSKEDQENRKLPRMNVLTGLNLSGICSCVKPQEFSKIRQSFYSPDRLCNVLEMLNAENVEPNLRRSALSQLSVMMDDVHLHSTFLEQKGLDKVLDILDNCLIEKEYRNYPDSVIPIVEILKALAMNNACIRQELSSRIEVLYSILRGLFLFSSDNTMRQNAVELLCLLLYSDCILRVPPDISIKCTVSFPEVVVNRMCLPFLTHIHGRSSRHLEPSLKKTLLNKENCSKLIRTCWAVEWVGSLSDLLAIQQLDLPDKTYSPGIPDDMKLCYADIECLKNCTFGLTVKQTLYNIQNATTHEAVFYSLHMLESYFLLYNIDKTTDGKNIGSDTSLSHMLWESTLERFMTSKPSCNQDESLLLQVIRFVQLLLKSFKSERLIDWVGKLLVDDHQPFLQILRKIGDENFGLVGRELRLAIIELAQETVTLKTSLDRTKWFPYIQLISDHLKLDKEEFYNVAYADWLLSLLVSLTGNWNWNFSGKTSHLENLIIRIMEIIIAFHCTKDSAISFMGMNIVKNSLIVLNQILSDSRDSVKDWEKLWFKAFTKVIGHVGDANYCWLLSLWFMRDSITRAAAYQLFVGFSTSSLACDLLIDRLNIQFDHVWSHGFRVLFDQNECSFVKEKGALLLSNLTSQGTRLSCGNFLQHIEHMKFYQKVVKVISYFYNEPKLPSVMLHETANCFAGEPVTSPSFITSICILIQSLMSINPAQVSEQILKNGIVESLTGVLGEIPESSNICGSHPDCVDTIRMYIAICRLVIRSMTSNCSVHSFMLQSQQSINYLFAMINYTLYCETSKTITSLKTELWCEILNLFSALLMTNPDCAQNENKEHAGFMLLNRSMTENGIDHFISSLYIGLTSDVIELRTAVQNFFVNLFRHELTTEKHITISDIFDRKISSKALKLCIENGWKALKISENLTLNFGIRAADIMYQMLLLSSSCSGQSCKTTVANSLGSLLAVCKPAQNFCVDRGLPDCLILNLKQICVKLNLENIENLKKFSVKKRIDPYLSESETCFRLINNLILGNERAKTAVADCALSPVVHKLWPWCMAVHSLLVVTLRMLCTFTYYCDQSCRTIVLSGSSTMMGLKKSPGSATLLNAIMNRVVSETDLTSSTHNPEILCLCLQLISNCCRVTECRAVISKGNFFQSFTKLHPIRKKRSSIETVMDSWLKFLIVFSCHQEGQLTLSKNQDVLDLIIVISNSSKPSQRLDGLTILRNICFHQLNKVRMLSSVSFLSLLLETLDSKRREEIQTAVVSVWALACNAQKAKLTLRNSGFEAKLLAAKRNCALNGDPETEELIETVLGILRNK